MARAPPHSAVVQVRPCWVPRHALFPRGCVRTISMKKSARIEMMCAASFMGPSSIIRRTAAPDTDL
jgi:hypothetical protein